MTVAEHECYLQTNRETPIQEQTMPKPALIPASYLVCKKIDVAAKFKKI